MLFFFLSVTYGIRVPLVSTSVTNWGINTPHEAESGAFDKEARKYRIFSEGN